MLCECEAEERTTSTFEIVVALTFSEREFEPTLLRPPLFTTCCQITQVGACGVVPESGHPGPAWHPLVASGLGHAKLGTPGRCEKSSSNPRESG